MEQFPQKVSIFYAKTYQFLRIENVDIFAKMLINSLAVSDRTKITCQN